MKGKISRVGAIVRSYNNPHVARQVINLLDMGVGKVIVVTNMSRDKGVTPHSLKDIDDARLSLQEMKRGYSWANGLNAGLRAIQMTNWKLKSRGKPPLDFILPVSVEVGLNLYHLQALLDEASDNRQFAMVGTSFADKDGVFMDLGLTYALPRNTAAVYNLDAFQCGIGGFDPQCDNEGGMEDLDMLIAIFAVTGKEAGLKVRNLDLRVPLTHWRHYNQSEKQKRELGANEKIFDRWLASYSPDSMEGRRVAHAVGHLRRQQEGARLF